MTFHLVVITKTGLLMIVITLIVHSYLDFLHPRRFVVFTHQNGRQVLLNVIFDDRGSCSGGSKDGCTME